MFMIRCDAARAYVRGLDADGMLAYALTHHSAKPFATVTEARTWWDEHAPAMPPLGDAGTRLMEVA